MSNSPFVHIMLNPVRSWRRVSRTVPRSPRGACVLMLLLAACGGGGSGGSSEEQPVSRPFAYVVTECREDAHTGSARQKLVIRQGEREITVRELAFDRLPALGLCPLYAASRFGESSVVVLPFQRLGISRDASTIVFEVTDDHSFVAPILAQPLLSPGEEEGIFVVGADGTGLRRLGPASREPSFRFFINPLRPLGVEGFTGAYFPFSPDGRKIAFTDLGPVARVSRPFRW